METKKVGPSIDKAINLSLKGHGFKRKGSSWCKQNDKTYFVVNRRATAKPYAEHGAVTSFRFAIWLGVYYRFIPNPSMSHRVFYSPHEAECHIRMCLPKSIGQAQEYDRTVWYVQPDVTNISEVAENVQTNIETVALPWFEKFSDLENAFAAIHNRNADDFGIFGWGNRNSPHYNFILGYLCLELGRKQMALECFEEVMKEIHNPLYPKRVEWGGLMNMPSSIVREDYERLKVDLEL